MGLSQSTTSALPPQELETRSLGKSVFLRRERGIWDQLQRQRGLLADANELLSAQSAEVEDLRLRCADAKVEAATAQTQLAPLAARVKELEEELTRAVSDRDAFRGRATDATASAMALVGQLGAEQRAHQLTKGTLDEALMVAEASQTEAVNWRRNAKGESCSLYLICFSCVRPLTPWCDTELAGEVSRAAEAARVEAQHLKELAEASRVEAQCWKEKAEAS